MKNSVQIWAEKLNTEYHKKRGWQKIVTVMAAIVVFCTTYALILPAITMVDDDTVVCGLVSHRHDDSCYEDRTYSVYACLNDLHQHRASCYDAEGSCICGYADYFIHTHDSDCYDEAGNLVCPLPEIREHIHDDSCVQIAVRACCPEELLDGHVHSETCYQPTKVLDCEQGGTVHEHDINCYVQIPVCDMEHEHFATCYEYELVCNESDEEPHEHSEGCYHYENSLVCGQEEG